MNKVRREQSFWGLTRGHRLRYVGAILLMGFGNALIFLVPLVSMAAIDGLLLETETETASESADAAAWLPRLTDRLLGSAPGTSTAAETLAVAAAAIVLLTAIAGVCFYLRRSGIARASEAIIERLRRRLYDQFGRLPASYHDQAETGDLVQRSTSDVETLRVFLSGQLVEIGRTALLLLAVLPLMLWLSPVMTLVSLALFPVVFVLGWIFFRRVKVLFLRTDEAEGELTAVLQENLTGIRVVRAFGRQAFESDKFAARNARYRDCYYRLMRLLGGYWAISDFICLGQVGLVLIAGAAWIERGAITVGTLFAFMTYELIIIWPVRHLGRVLADTGKASVAYGRIQEILREPTEAELDRHAGKDRRPAEPVRGDIQLENVSFSYDGGIDALAQVSFKIPAGSTVAILGPPGSGKSTIIHLLLRLYDYDRGSVRLDGQELSELDRSFLRQQYAVVLQEPFLYSKSVEENIRVGHQDASRDQVVECAHAAAVHGDVSEFEHGYETLVGERGVTLSGGQRQRVALARALLRDAPILVLDDALSAIDTDTEADILRAFRERPRDRTTIVIAHRLSSVIDADRIVMLEGGRVVQSGAHRELLAQDGPYRRLWQIQDELEQEIVLDSRRP